MKPVNLLPQNERAVKAAEGLGGSSYVVLGVLGALLLAVLTFVFSQNQVNDRASKIGETQAEAQQAEQRATALGAFGSFASVKQQREESVRQLASARFDWERFMRELSLVLPSGTSLLDVSASTDGSSASGAAGAAAPAPAPAPAPATPPAGATGTTATPATPATPAVVAATPKAQMIGCALSHKHVATLMVRLGKMKGASDVELKESATDDTVGATDAPSDSAAGGNTGCPPKKFKFEVAVTFAPAATPAADDTKPRKTPARLGGGA